MDVELAQSHRLLNRLQSVLLLLAMAGLLVLAGWLFAGMLGVVWSLVLAFVLAVFSPSLSPGFMLRMYQARELSPDRAAGLYRVVAELSRRAGLDHMPRLFYVASPVLNAFALGTPRGSYLVLSEGVLCKLTPRELTGVLAHEISHIRHNDTSVMGLADLFSRLTGVLSTAGQLLLIFNLPLILFSDYSINWWAIGVLIAAPVVSALIQLALSRTREYDADIGAAELTGDPEGLASALHKIERYQHSVFEQILMPGRGVPEPSILRTHPHTRDRLERLRALQPRPASGRLRQPDIPELVVQPARRLQPRWRSMGMWY
jgi:heat shock protein HtpX